MTCDLDALRAEVVKKLPDRAAHILGVEETAVRLALQWGADEFAARQAALLHDITKECSHFDQLKMAAKYGILCRDEFDAFPAQAHAWTGAEVARHEYGVPDAVAEAIRNHTAGRAGMGLLDKIIYLADMIEPNRFFDGVEAIRREALQDLDSAILMAVGRSMIYLIQKSRMIHPASMEMYNGMISQASPGK